ncbi:MAG: PIN domain-containing protein [Deltaproteobacteria bacterium]|nr:PIN domain-containing protein [Deltaproteobacteria bacterium]
MISVDTNILLYAYDNLCSEHQAAHDFLIKQKHNRNFCICELVLVELYVLLRNPKIVTQPLAANEAVGVVQAYRTNHNWAVIEGGNGIMQEVWAIAKADSFARRRIFDARLAFTLLHNGVTAFATHNVADFEGFGFSNVWDPIENK